MAIERAEASVFFQGRAPKVEAMPAAYVSKFYTGHKRFFFSVSVPLDMRERLLAGAGLSEGEAEAAPDQLARYIGRILEKAWAELPPF